MTGSTYYIVVSGYGSASGAFQLNITATDGSAVSSLPIRGRYAVAQAVTIAPALANGSSSGVLPLENAGDGSQNQTMITCRSAALAFLAWESALCEVLVVPVSHFPEKRGMPLPALAASAL